MTRFRWGARLLPGWLTSERLSATVTFLFTDIEGSTGLLKRVGRARYGEILAEQQRLLRGVFATHGGEEIDSQGDSFFVAFRSAGDALTAAVAIQRALAEHGWPEGADVRVRIGIHTGEAAAAGERYVGVSVHRAARIGAAAHGGQVLVSSSTRELVEDDLPDGVYLRDLGRVRLKDIDRPERVSQLAAEGLRLQFPPLRTGGGRRPAAPRLRLLVPVALLVVAGAVAAGFVLSRGGGGAARASAVAADSVGVFEPGRGGLVAQVPVKTRPSSVAYGAGSVWVANVDDDSVSRIDAETNAVVQTIPVGDGPSGVAFGAGFVWVANGLQGTVSKIDPRVNGGSGGLVDSFPVGNGPTGVAFGAGRLWVANSSDRTVSEFAPASPRRQRTIPVAAGADAIAFGSGFLWVASEAGNSVTRIEARSGTVLAPINVGTSPRALAVGAGAVWVANNQDGTVSRIDAHSGDVQAAIPVGNGPNAVATSDHGVWVSNELAGTFARIDPAENKVVQTVKTGNRPQGLVLTAGALYVAVRASSLAHRGGTLTVAANVFAGPDSQTTIMTNDGLTALRHVGGSEGTQLVPDLATSLPAPSDGGRTYTFQLRRGIRYSTGAPVRPADVRRGIERALLNQSTLYGGFYFEGIVGAAACVKTPKHCDLSRGIVADSAANTVTFHLTTSDPDLLYKLTFGSTVPIPAGTPLRARVRLPATGPYMVKSVNPGHVFRLVRNPYFHVWSAAAQPRGYPDEIVWKVIASPEARVRAVERGRADLMWFGSSDRSSFLAGLSALRREYASQLHLSPLTQTNFLSLNTRVSPFNDVRVRRAANYAFDRNGLVDRVGGPDLARASCQVLPPNTEGYRRYCPYTRNRTADGKYTGPDLARARKLVAASGTKGQSVTVWILKSFAPYAASLVSALKKIGYHARLHVIKDADGQQYVAAISDSRRRVQASGMTWAPDYAAASGFIPALLSCRSFRPASPNQNINVAEFCNRAIDVEITRARALQTSDPPTASRLWSKIDRDIVDQAPWVVQLNPIEPVFVARRVGNYQYNPQYGVLYDQLWVR